MAALKTFFIGKSWDFVSLTETIYQGGRESISPLFWNSSLIVFIHHINIMHDMLIAYIQDGIFKGKVLERIYGDGG